jgi:hypothetical protein
MALRLMCSNCPGRESASRLENKLMLKPTTALMSPMRFLDIEETVKCAFREFMDVCPPNLKSALTRKNNVVHVGIMETTVQRQGSELGQLADLLHCNPAQAIWLTFSRSEGENPYLLGMDINLNFDGNALVTPRIVKLSLSDEAFAETSEPEMHVRMIALANKLMGMWVDLADGQGSHGSHGFAEVNPVQCVVKCEI